MRLVAADLEAVVVTDAIDARPYYYATAERVDDAQQLSHRAFWFTSPLRTGIDGQSDTAMTATWSLTLAMVFDADAYLPMEYAAQLGREQSRLAQTVEARTDWTDGGNVVGIWHVQVDSSDVVLEDGYALILTRLSAVIGEAFD